MRNVVLIRGGNDIASAVAHRLFTSGYGVMILEARQPLTVRRGMAYASAVYDGRISLAGVTAERAFSLEQAFARLEARQVIPVLGTDEAGIVPAIAPQVLVDARLRKKERSGTRIGDAPLVIGLGPGFTAGIEAHLVIETNRGPNLGRIITRGEAEPYNGEPVAIAGHGKARYVYAARQGIFRTSLDLGSRVEQGQVVGEVAGDPVVAGVGGAIRGIARDGLAVPAGAKLVDIDPRETPAPLSELSQKAWVIADAVLTAVRTAVPCLP
jgi:xanthine dehydrogenase accessory factor